MEIPKIPNIPNIPIPEPKISGSPHTPQQDPGDPASGAAVPKGLVDHLAKNVPNLIGGEESGLDIKIKYPEIDATMQDIIERAKQTLREGPTFPSELPPLPTRDELLDAGSKLLQAGPDVLREGAQALFPIRGEYPTLFQNFRSATNESQSGVDTFNGLVDRFRRQTENGRDAASNGTGEDDQNLWATLTKTIETERDRLRRILENIRT